MTFAGPTVLQGFISSRDFYPSVFLFYPPNSVLFIISPRLLFIVCSSNWHPPATSWGPARIDCRSGSM